jgi:hypothetical protein
MTMDLANRKIAILATDGVERVELEQPRGALYGAGAASDLLSVHFGEIQARQFDLVSAGTFSVDHLVGDASAGDYDALLLPGAPSTRTRCGSILKPSPSSSRSWRPASRSRRSAMAPGRSSRRTSSGGAG